MIIIQFGVFPPPSLGLVGSEMKGVLFLLLLCFIFQMGLEKTQVAARNLSRSQGEDGEGRRETVNHTLD